MINRGLFHFRCSASGDELTEYHLQAEIAALHTLADDFASTDWQRILNCYDELQNQRNSPIVELNRLIASAHVDGPEKGLRGLQNFESVSALNSLNLFHIAKAHLFGELCVYTSSLQSYKTALELTENDTVRRFLLKKISESLSKL